MDKDKFDSILHKIKAGQISLQDAYTEILKQNNSSKSSTGETLVLQTDWNARALGSTKNTFAHDSIIFFGDKDNLSHYQNNESIFSDATSISIAPDFRKISNKEFEAPINHHSFESLIQELSLKEKKEIAFVFDLSVKIENGQQMLENARKYFYALFYLVSEAIHQKLNNKINILFVCKDKNIKVNPFIEAINGLSKSILIEKSNIVVKVVGIEQENEGQLTNIIADELNDNAFDTDLILYQNNQRFVSELVEVSDREGDAAFKNDGTYLITGGGGKIGLFFANYIAKKYSGSKIILVGRSPQNAAIFEFIDETKAYCKDICYMQTDISSAEELKKLKSVIEPQYGHLSGIIIVLVLQKIRSSRKRQKKKSRAFLPQK